LRPDDSYQRHYAWRKHGQVIALAQRYWWVACGTAARSSAYYAKDEENGIFNVDTEPFMKSKVQKWGNSLALRIPKSFAEEADVGAGSEIDLQLREGRLVVVPIRRRPTLKALLEQVTPENTHHETDMGSTEGNEIW
jgi:antitoxin MazE